MKKESWGATKINKVNRERRKKQERLEKTRASSQEPVTSRRKVTT